MLTSHQRLIFNILLLTSHSVIADQLKAFSSDGCSQFPDGTLSEKNLWCGCCITHDIAYWQGGSEQQKKQADEALQACVLKSTNNAILAKTMYVGVRFGGLPIFPVWYRWGYGWQYGRGFQPLNQEETRLVKTQIQQYQSTLPKNYCEFDYPPTTMIKESWQDLLENLKITH
mgnify:CR=1 FL=1